MSIVIQCLLTIDTFSATIHMYQVTQVNQSSEQKVNFMDFYEWLYQPCEIEEDVYEPAWRVVDAEVF